MKTIYREEVNSGYYICRFDENCILTYIHFPTAIVT